MIDRTLKLGMAGKDVEALKRAVYRCLGKGKLTDLINKPTLVRRYYGVGFRSAVKQVQKKAGLPQTGTIGPQTFDWLQANGCFDKQAQFLYKQHLDEKRKKLEEKKRKEKEEKERKEREALIKKYAPNQGWSSLHPSLHRAYSLGRASGLSDLGTYNPASRLPSGAPSDHAVYPAMAFDLGIEPDTGWNNTIARRYVQQLASDAYKLGIEYIILGDMIWTRSEGWHRYYSGGHLNHVHVSGVR